MTVEKDKLEAFFIEQIALEEQIIKTAKASVKNSRNELVKNLIEGIALDSSKHALILKALLAQFTKKTPFISEQKRDELSKNIKEHISLEAKAIQTYGDLIPQTDDPGIRNVLEYILEDEKRHHELLKRIYELVIEKETLTEQDIWDLVWKDVPWHGGPGG